MPRIARPVLLLVDSQRLAANLQEMEGRPFDGVVVRIAGQTPEGRSVPLQWRRVLE